MRRKALTLAVLVATLTLADTTEVRAAPAFSTIIVVGDGAVRRATSDRFRTRHVLQHSRRSHSGFDRHRFDRHRVFVRHHHVGRVGRHAFGTRVIVLPVPRRSLHRHLPVRPLIRHGSFARRSFHWHSPRW